MIEVPLQGSEFGIEGLGFGVWGVGVRFWGLGLGCSIRGVGFGVRGVGIKGLVSRTQGSMIWDLGAYFKTVGLSDLGAWGGSRHRLVQC